MGNSIVSYIHSTFLVFSQWTLWLLGMTNECFIEYRFQVQQMQDFLRETEKMGLLIPETEEVECFACRILPMTSTYGQGNFSVKKKKKKPRAGNEQSSKVGNVCNNCDFAAFGLGERNVLKLCVCVCVCVQMPLYLQRSHYACALNNLLRKQPGLSFWSTLVERWTWFWCDVYIEKNWQFLGLP